MSVILLVVSIVLWGGVHSILASLRVKTWFIESFGAPADRFYRLGYNLFAGLSLIPVVLLVLFLPDRLLYRLNSPWSLVFVLVQVTALVLLIVGVLQTDTIGFIGLRQVFETRKSNGRLVRTGLYRWVRHPLYFAGLLFIWFTPELSANFLVLYLSLSVYILVGAHFEEQRLLREFGADYIQYQVDTAMLFPGLKIPWMRDLLVQKRDREINK